jgi:oligopeptidase B
MWMESYGLTTKVYPAKIAYPTIHNTFFYCVCKFITRSLILITILSASLFLTSTQRALAFSTSKAFSSRSFFLSGDQNRNFLRIPSFVWKRSHIGVMAASLLNPPIPRREETRVVWAGRLDTSIANDTCPSNPTKPLARQSESSHEALLDPPVAVPDPYGWMRDESRTKEEVLKHLQDENAYTQAMTEHLEPLREALYKEMLSSIQETDYTLPRPRQEWMYYSRTFEGKSYSIHCRAPRTQNAVVEWDKSAQSPILSGEQVILDINSLAEGRKYCSVEAVKTSPSQKLLAYSVDFTGGETCELHVVDLDSKETVDHDPELAIAGSIVWGNDDKVLFYSKMDDAHRPFQVYKRILGSNVPDELLFHEPDELYWVGISKSRDGKYFFVESSSKETSEHHFLDLQDPSATLQCVAKKRTKVLYDVEHRFGYWWITTNFGPTPNMRLMKAPAMPDSEEEWKDVTIQNSHQILFDGSYDRSLEGIDAFQTHIVAQGRENGIPRVWIISLDMNDDITGMELLTFDEEAHDVGLQGHYEFDTDRIVVSYESMITPPSSLEILLSDTSVRNVLKTKEVPGYDKNLYDCERTNVLSRDGKTEIPVSMVYRKDVLEQHLASGEPVHTHLYGYGSYGACMEADFRATRLTLLNRGIIFVIAHVRGGGEMGRQWYEEPNGAKYLCKKNTFNDFVDVANWLVHDRKLTNSNLLSCEGRSAGGLLIGASINQAPELFKMAVLGVPFVDVVPTMIDASIPLTAVEWEEWGCPNEEKFFSYMMEYSPINNVQKGAKYPACLLTGGLHDPRVQFWEPAKFAAELRHTQGEGSGPVCLKIDMAAGHFSASDRYKYYKELAFDYAFLLDQVGLSTLEK